MTDVDLDSVEAVAIKDFQDAIRSRALLAVTTVFVVFFVSASYFFVDQIGGQIAQQGAQQGAQQAAQLSSNSFLRSLTNVTRLLVPLAGAVVAYASIIGERESGTLKLLLALPHSRLDVVLGKFAGRATVLTVPVTLGLLVALPIFVLADVTFSPSGYLVFAVVTVLVGLAFVAIGLGASAAAKGSRQAVVGTFLPYVLFTALWGQLPRRVVGWLQREFDLGNQAALELFFLVRAVNPIGAYQMIASNVGSPRAQLRLFSPPSRQSTYVQQFGELPFYLTDTALVVYLLVWIVVPIVIGYLVFERTDL